MKIVAILHTEKVEGLLEKPVEIAVNPTLTVNGMEKIRSIAHTLWDLGPFDACYSSRLARALDAASVLCLAFDLDLQTLKDLGQYANKDGDTIAYYPGHEKEGFEQWQKMAVRAIEEIHARHEETDTVLAVSHGPVIAGLIAHTKNIRDKAGIKQILDNLRSEAQQYVVFEVNGDGIKVAKC